MSAIEKLLGHTMIPNEELADLRASAAGPWRKYPDEKPEELGWYLVFRGLNHAFADEWRDDKPRGPRWVCNGTNITHWAEIRLPEEETDEST